MILPSDIFSQFCDLWTVSSSSASVISSWLALVPSFWIFLHSLSQQIWLGGGWWIELVHKWCTINIYNLYIISGLGELLDNLYFHLSIVCYCISRLFSYFSLFCSRPFCPALAGLLLLALTRYNIWNDPFIDRLIFIEESTRHIKT